jgi:hypothetical protein
MNNFSRPFRPRNSLSDSSECLDASYAGDRSHDTTPDVEDIRGSADLAIQNFRDEISADGDGPRPPPTRPPDRSVEIDASSYSSRAPMYWEERIKPLLLPMLAVTCPLALVSGALLGLVYGYRVGTGQSLFAPNSDTDGNGYVLVNYPATRLLFAASFLSTLAPILGSFVMTLWSLIVARDMRTASISRRVDHLPTPYQLSLIIGLTLASTERLWRYYVYLFSRSRSSIPPVMHHAAKVFTINLVLAFLVFLTDIDLHYSTQTVPFQRVIGVSQPQATYGRGITQFCLDFNRTANAGLPCSYTLLVNDPNALPEDNEIFYLQHNISNASEIRLISADGLVAGDLAILVPQDPPAEVDYRASTIGISTQCTPITSMCSMKTNFTSLYTSFNCSSGLYGTLGKSPNINEISSSTADPQLPPLGFKPAPNIQYGFFTDKTLDNPYNPVGYDPATDQPGLSPLLDSELVNPIYLGIAARFGDSVTTLNNDFTNDSEIHSGQGQFFDFALSCPCTSYDVNYTWVNGEIQNATFFPTINGSVMEIFHGKQLYTTFAGGEFDLQDYIQRAAMQPTSASLAHEWSNLYSTKILATIGAYTSPRVVMQEQKREALLVAKVPVGSLAVLIASSLTFTPLGIYLGIVAYKVSVTDVRDIAARLSVSGLIDLVFGERTRERGEPGYGTNGGAVFDEKPTRQETRRVIVDGNAQSGYFGVLA